MLIDISCAYNVCTMLSHAYGKEVLDDTRVISHHTRLVRGQVCHYVNDGTNLCIESQRASRYITTVKSLAN